jgi:hypothetical protein
MILFEVEALTTTQYVKPQPSAKLDCGQQSNNEVQEQI